MRIVSIAVVSIALLTLGLAQQCTPNIGDEQSTQCVWGEFCTLTRYTGVNNNNTNEPMSDRGCRVCDVAPHGAQLGDGVYDPLNVCNCAAGTYCRQTAPSFDEQATLVGYCQVSTLVGINCSSDADCEAERERSLDGGYSRRERGYCVDGRCAQCNLPEFVMAYGSDSFVCPGYVLQADGLRRYLSARSGVRMQCTATGALVEHGSVNLDLRASTEQTSTITTTTSTTATNVADKDKNEEPDYVPALLSLNFIVSLTTLVILITTCIALLVCAVKVYAPFGERSPTHCRQTDEA